AHVPGGRVETVEVVVVGADVDLLLPHRRRAVDVAAGALRPAQLPARRPEGVDLVVRRADVDATIGDGRRRVERPARAEPGLCAGLPDEPSGPRVERVDVAVVRAEEDATAGVRHGALDRGAGPGRPGRPPGGRG